MCFALNKILNFITSTTNRRKSLINILSLHDCLLITRTAAILSEKKISFWLHNYGPQISNKTIAKSSLIEIWYAVWMSNQGSTNHLEPYTVVKSKLSDAPVHICNFSEENLSSWSKIDLPLKWSMKRCHARSSDVDSIHWVDFETLQVKSIKCLKTARPGVTTW